MKNSSIIISIFIAFTLFVSPLGYGNYVLAQGGNTASQGISQGQSSNQNSNVVSGGNTEDSGNNENTQTQANTGSNTAAQEGGSD